MCVKINRCGVTGLLSPNVTLPLTWYVSQIFLQLQCSGHPIHSIRYFIQVVSKSPTPPRCTAHHLKHYFWLLFPSSSHSDNDLLTWDRSRTGQWPPADGPSTPSLTPSTEGAGALGAWPRACSRPAKHNTCPRPLLVMGPPRPSVAQVREGSKRRYAKNRIAAQASRDEEKHEMVKR